ncbi:hypothetical protein LTS08_001321 [Lithohypha guttulata]|uniref:uncharacterized protein n=1 Tax=Lithohypha guttulata TaxID=1690604 RepID=UPI002DE19387|nr:hypothetical protein LTR51_004012 [Lithohypha guttulata]KAK5105048.1 hypothetical protein LTS08_001321 [Lithohypha guttulata]
MLTLEEVDFKTVETYQLKQWKKPKRLKLCLKCSPRRSSIIYSWKNPGAEGVAFLDSNEWSRCRVGGACGSPWSEFWDVDELASGRTRQEGETASPENTDLHKQQKASELTLIKADRNHDQVKNFERMTVCGACDALMVTLQEVDQITILNYKEQRLALPRRLVLCRSCSITTFGVVYSWKGWLRDAVDQDGSWALCRRPKICRADIVHFWEVHQEGTSHNCPSLLINNDQRAEDNSVSNPAISTAAKRPRQNSDLGEQHHKLKAPRLDVPLGIPDVQDELNASLGIHVDRSLKITYVPQEHPDELKQRENWTMKVYFSGLGYQSQLIGTGMGDTKSIAASNAARDALQNPLLEEIKAKRVALSQLANSQEEESREPLAEGTGSRAAGDALQDTQPARRASVASRRPVPSRTNSIDIFTERNSRIWNSLSWERGEPDTDSPSTSVSFGILDTAPTTGVVALAERDQSKESRKENVPIHESTVVPKEGLVQEDDPQALSDKLSASSTASDTSSDLKQQASTQISSVLENKPQLKLQTQDPRRRRDPLLLSNINVSAKEGDVKTTMQQQQKRDDTEQCPLAVGEGRESDIDLRRAQELLEKVQTEGEGSLNDVEAAEMMALLSKHSKDYHIGVEEPRHSNIQQTHAHLEEVSSVAMSSPLPPPPPSPPPPPPPSAPGLPSPARSPSIETRDRRTNQEHLKDQRTEKPSVPDTELFTETTEGLEDISTSTELAPDVTTPVDTVTGPSIRGLNNSDVAASATIIQSVPMSPLASLSPEATAPDDVESTSSTVSKIGQTTYVDSFGLLRVHPDLLRAFGIEPHV